MGKFDGKVAIITGASGGIGLATAIAFSQEGAKVSLIGRNKERLADAAKKCQEAGSEALEISGDMADFAFLPTIVDKTVEKFGRIDILVNNAGTGTLGNFESVTCTPDTYPPRKLNPGPMEQKAGSGLTLEVFDEIFNTNVKGPVFLSQKALPHLKKTKGCVVNVSSLAGQMPETGIGAYALSKAALDHFARCLAAECAKDGVRANNVSPAGVMTGFLARLDVSEEEKQGLLEKLTRKQALGFIKPEQVAEAILFLASAEMLTGNVLPVDAGLLVA